MGGQVNSLVAGISDSMRFNTKTITFDGTSGLGAIGQSLAFTITGQVLGVYLSVRCLTDLGVDGGTGAASVSLGTANSSVAFVAAVLATDIDAAEFFLSTTPPLYYRAIPNTCKDFVVSDNIIAEITSSGTQKVNAGVLRFDLYWIPLSSDANVT